MLRVQKPTWALLRYYHPHGQKHIFLLILKDMSLIHSGFGLPATLIFLSFCQNKFQVSVLGVPD